MTRPSSDLTMSVTHTPISDNSSFPSPTISPRHLLFPAPTSNILQQMPKPNPRLQNSRDNLTSRQHEPKPAPIPQLNGICILGLSNTINIIRSRTGVGIQSAATRAIGVSGAVNGKKLICCSPCCLYQLYAVLGDDAAVVAICYFCD